VGSSPTRPTVSKSWSTASDLAKRPDQAVSFVAGLCGSMRSKALLCGSLRQIRVKIGRAVGSPRLALLSVLAQRFADPPLGEFVLTLDALGVDPQRHVDAVPGPLRHLSGIDAAVQPRGQASMP
jgi:hypothetical protein